MTKAKSCGQKLNERLFEIKEILESLRPTSPAQSESMDYLMIQAYVAGFVNAYRIVEKEMKDD